MRNQVYTNSCRMISSNPLWSLLLILLVLKFHKIKGDEFSEIEMCSDCKFESSNNSLHCKDLNITDSEFKILNFQCLPESQKSHVSTLEIENVTMSTLNLNFTTANHFPQLSSIIVNGSNVSTVVGEIPCNISLLRVTYSALRNFTAVLCENVDHALDSHSNSSGKLNKTSIPKRLTLDLKNNSLEELPVNVVSSRRLQSLHLSENRLRCEFIWENVWENLDCQTRRQACQNLFLNQNTTTCQFLRQRIFQSGIFHYNLEQIFDSKSTLEDECSEMNKTCDCHPYNLLRNEGDKPPTVYLSVDCSGKKFTELPNISKYTWELNVSDNRIQDLGKLNLPTYKNLRRLDLSHNLIDDLNDISNSSFIMRFDSLYINANKFKKIPDIFWTNVKKSEGKGMLKLGSALECVCHTATHTKGRMIEIKNNIIDIDDVVCWNFMNEDENATSKFLRLMDLWKIMEVCPPDDSSSLAFNWVVLVIVLEVIGITVVVLKVFYDWRKYQRTGILPWIAEKLPRLPCDGILE